LQQASVGARFIVLSGWSGPHRHVGRVALPHPGRDKSGPYFKTFGSEEKV
jgi:hypothetical protein